MNTTIARTFDRHLRAIFDTEDPVYKSLISTEPSSPEATVTKPMDLNAGAIASVFEWLRRLGKDMLIQLDMSQAEERFLNLAAHDHIGIVRYPGESDGDYVYRVQKFLFGEKTTRAAIIHHMRQFSTTEPLILEGIHDACFADVSFTDVYQGFRNQTPGPEYQHYVFPAITTNAAGSVFFFILELTETPSSEIKELLDWMDRWVSVGISYEIRINR